jgi:hypothetical protein
MTLAKTNVNMVGNAGIEPTTQSSKPWMIPLQQFPLLLCEELCLEGVVLFVCNPVHQEITVEVVDLVLT